MFNKKILFWVFVQLCSVQLFAQLGFEEHLKNSGFPFGMNKIVTIDDNLVIVKSVEGDFYAYQFKEIDSIQEQVLLNNQIKPFLNESFDFIVADTAMNLLFAYQKNDSLPLKLIDYSQDSLGVILSSDSSFSISFEIDGVLNFEKNDEKYYLFDGEKEYYLKYRSNDLKTLGLSLLPDSLIVFTNIQSAYCLPKLDNESRVLKDEDGNKVYKKEGKNRSSSAVYDLVKNEWITTPLYKEVQSVNNHLIVSKLIDTECDENGYSSKELFGIINHQDSIVEEFRSYNEMFESPSFINMLIPNYEIDSVFREAADLDYSSIYYFKTRDNKTGALIFDKFISDLSYNLIQPREFLHVGPKFNWWVYIDNDSLILEMKDDSVYRLNTSKGEINAALYPYNITDEYHIQMIDEEDTLYKSNTNKNIFIQNIPKYDNERYLNKVQIKLVSENKLVLTDLEQEKEVEKYLRDKEGNGLNSVVSFSETERSAIYEKSTNGWTRKTPNYAEVIPTKMGFIVRTAAKKNQIDYDDEGYAKAKKDGWNVITRPDVSARFILLDSAYKAISIADYYDFTNVEDLGYGLKVCIDSGQCMFMDYHQNAVTDFNWDEFQMKENKVEAIKYSEKSDKILKTELFDLPKK